MSEGSAAKLYEQRNHKGGFVADDGGPQNGWGDRRGRRVRDVTDAEAGEIGGDDLGGRLCRHACGSGGRDDWAAVEAPNHERTCPEEGTWAWFSRGVGDHRPGCSLLAPPIVLRLRSPYRTPSSIY